MTRSSWSTSWVAASASPKRVIASAEAAALGLELGEPRLELVRHVVERRAEQRELVAAANGDALVEPAARDPVRRLGEAAKRSHDRASLEVRDERDERERDDQPEQQAVARARVGGVDQRLRAQHREAHAGGVGGRRGDERAEAFAADGDGLHLPEPDGTLPRTVGDDATILPACRMASESVGARPLRARSISTSPRRTAPTP